MPKPPKPAQQRGKTSAKSTKAHPQRGKRGLTEMQKHFCEFLAQGCDQTEAMKKAGSTAKQPSAQATRWLKLPKVKTYLASLPQQKQQEADRRERIATAQERQEWWTQIMRGDIEVESYDMFGNMVLKKPSLPQRLQAAETLGKAQGDFKDDDSNKVQPQVIINLPTRAMTQQEIEEARRANGNA